MHEAQTNRRAFWRIRQCRRKGRAPFRGGSINNTSARSSNSIAAASSSWTLLMFKPASCALLREQTASIEFKGDHIVPAFAIGKLKFPMPA